MAELIFLTLLGVVFVAASLRILSNEGDPAIRMWTFGWLAFIASGILGHASEVAPAGADVRVPLFFAYVASSAAPLFFLFGVFSLVRWTCPGWVAPMGAAIVMGRAFSGGLGDEVTAELLSVPVEVGPNLGAAYLLWRWSRHSGRPHHQTALVWAHVLMGLAEGFMAATWIQGWDRQASKMLLSAASLFLAGSQIVVVLRLSSDRVDEAIEDRERDLALLRDLAHLGTRHAAGPPLLQEAAGLLRDRLAVDWVGFWRWSTSEVHWVATEAADVPDDVCRQVQVLALRVDDLAAQPSASARPNLVEVTEGCDQLDDGCTMLVPLEWQGEVLGVMGMGRLHPRHVPPNVRSVLPTLAGELTLSLQHVLSIQQRDRANLELLRERRKLAGVIETAPIGLLVTTADGRIELMNSAAAEHIGCNEPERFIGGDMSDFLEDFAERVPDPDHLIELIRHETDAHGVLRDLEYEVMRPEPATLLLFSSRVHDDEGRTTAHIWASRDVTAERALGDQLRHAQKLETIGTLSGGIAHDFNNQLAVILGNARFARDTLEHEDVRVDDVDEALEDLERAADHCAQLTRSLLSFARRAPVALGPVGPNALVRDLGDLLRPLMPTSIVLDCDDEPDLPSMMADGAQLQQVLVNLALNARDAIEARGEIHIRARLCDLDLDHVRRSGLGRPGRHIVFEVRDSGHGLDASTRERIFEPFYTTKPVGQGTGLGLAIVHGVVSAHGGWIDVESEPGEGTEFRIHLPVDESSSPGEIDDAHDVIALATAADQRDRILVADDDAAVRSVLARALESRGFVVVTAEDGEDAVKRFADDVEGFAGVVLDWTMPGLRGPEAAEEILAIDPDVPVILATGHGDVENERGLEVMTKPFDMNLLASRLREMIGG